MKQKPIILTLIAFLIISAFFANRFVEKLKQKDRATQAMKEAVAPVKTSANIPKTRFIDFVSQPKESDAAPDVSEADKLALSYALSFLNTEFKFVLISKDVSKTINILGNSRKLSAGLVSGVRFAGMMSRSNMSNLSPIFIGSKDSKYEGYLESQVVANDHVGKIQDIQGKIVGIEERNVLLATLFLSDLKEKNILPKKIIIFSNNAEARSYLTDKKIDVLLSSVDVFSNGKIETGFGAMEANSFVLYPGLKILHTSHFKFPYRVMFISDKFNDNFKKQFAVIFARQMGEKKSMELFSRTMGISSVRKVNLQSLKPLVPIITKAIAIPIESLASEVIRI